MVSSTDDTAREKGPIAWLIRIRQLPFNLNLLLGGTGTAALVLLVLVGPLWLGLDAYTHNFSHILEPPSLEGPGLDGLMGTDTLGRDVFSRIVVGGRSSLIISVSAVILTAAIGTALGLASGYFEGWLGVIIMRIADVQLAMPFIVLTITILTVLSPTIPNIILALAITRWVVYARTSRALVLSIKRSDYILGARALGVSDAGILWRYILPNMFGTMVVLGGLQLAVMVIMESTLSYLGLGIQPPEPSWGNMMREGQAYLSTAWWIAAFPGLFAMLFVLSINLFAEGLRSVAAKRTRL